MEYVTTDTELTSIANAIRTKGGTSAPLVYPNGFVNAIGDIPTGGTDLTSEDEGKVVVESDGAYVLQAQTSLNISQNGTYDTTTNDEVVVSVSGGGGSPATLVPKTITENGTYNPSDDQADGYSSVTVSVPTSSGGYTHGYFTSVGQFLVSGTVSATAVLN